jgi:DNA modification methylase
MTLHHGDCIEVMRGMADNSVDSIVTDPPYELGFMGKSWDSTGIAYSVEMWTEALRVLKPGGHLLAFSGSRTYHRMAVAIEDAGFQIRDQIMWLYGSGFPKSHNVSKGIDKAGGVGVSFHEFRDAVKIAMDAQGIRTSALRRALGNYMLSHYLSQGSQPAVPNYRDYKIIRDFVNLGDAFDHLFADEVAREVVGTKMSGIANAKEGQRHTIGASKAIEVDITAPSTPAAQQWEGWGTALKPAHEPIVLARKPFAGTVASNVLQHGTGALNIDGSRVGTTDSFGGEAKGTSGFAAGYENDGWVAGSTQGRWPANVIHDGSDEVVDGFPDNGSAARFFYCAKANKRDRNEGLDGFAGKEIGGKGNGLARTCATCGASVLDGCQCPDRTFTNPTRANHHPTVKPVDLMRYLVKLITPPKGVVLDPFMGSGSTGKGAVIEGFNFVGIEQDADYLDIARARIQWAGKQEVQLGIDD